MPPQLSCASFSSFLHWADSCLPLKPQLRHQLPLERLPWTPGEFRSLLVMLTMPMLLPPQPCLPPLLKGTAAPTWAAHTKARPRSSHSASFSDSEVLDLKSYQVHHSEPAARLRWDPRLGSYLPLWSSPVPPDAIVSQVRILESPWSLIRRELAGSWPGRKQPSAWALESPGCS